MARIGVRRKRRRLADRYAPHSPGRDTRSKVRHIATQPPVVPVTWGCAPVFSLLHAHQTFLRPWRLAKQKLLLIVAPTGGVFTVPEFFPRSPQGETCRQHRRGLQPLPSRSDHWFYPTVTANNQNIRRARRPRGRRGAVKARNHDDAVAM